MDGLNLRYGSYTHGNSSDHTHTHTRHNRPALPYRQKCLLSHLMLFRSLTMLSFGPGNHGDAYVCVCVCVWMKDRISEEGLKEHTLCKTQLWLNHRKKCRVSRTVWTLHKFADCSSHKPLPSLPSVNMSPTNSFNPFHIHKQPVSPGRGLEEGRDTRSYFQNWKLPVFARCIRNLQTCRRGHAFQVWEGSASS